MKITDLKYAIIGRNPVVRIVADAGISGYGEAESYKPYLKPHVLALRDALIGEDPDPIVKDSMITVWDRPGMGIEINPAKAKRYLTTEDAAFFD